jgi:ribonuclease HII
MRILGIDEAGRGCVIGPMAVGGVVFQQSDVITLKKLGVKDSKQLSLAKRTELANVIMKKAQAEKVILIPPDQINTVSLNELDLQAILKLINKFQPDQAIFDVPTHPQGVEWFVQAVDYRLDLTVELIGENKADEKYPVVSAASILAKVKRDQIIEKLKQDYGDFGSGYMSDPKTQQFLKDWYEEKRSFPKIVRTKWASAKRLLFQQQKLT